LPAWVIIADERSPNLQLCGSCKSQCEQLLRFGNRVSLLIEQITTLLLQNSRFTLIHPKQTIIQNLFSNCNLPKFSTNAGLKLLDRVRVGSHNLNTQSGLTINTADHDADISHLDRQIEELETQFHLDRIKGYHQHGSGTHSEDENNSDRESSSSSLYSFLPSLVSFDSSSSAQKDPLGNNIMNVNISALESSGSSGHEQVTPPKRCRASKLSSSPKNIVTSITNLIANTTNDELDVCLSSKIQKMKRHRATAEERTNERTKSADNVFRLPLPPNSSPIIRILKSPSPPLQKSISKSTGKSDKKRIPTKEEKKSKKRFSCVLCQKTWETKKDLNTHMGSHLKISNYVCDICGMAYR